jgi:hypothetical protein
MAQVQQVLHRLARPNVVIDDDGTGGIAESALDLDGWDPRIDCQHHVLRAKSGREDEPVDPATEKGLHAFTLTLGITLSVENQHIETTLDGGVLNAHGDLGEERVWENAVKGEAESDRALPAQGLRNGVKSVPAFA